MIKANKFILALCFLKIEATTTGYYGLTRCKAQQGISNRVKWPATSSTRAVSDPPCVDESKIIMYRECIGDNWGPEPSCNYIQFETPRLCPEGFFEAGNICYQITPPTTFPPSCPFDNILPFLYAMSFVTENISSVWFPVTRNVSNGFDFLRWVEPSIYYKNKYKVTTPDSSSNKVQTRNCLLYQKERDNVQLVSCNEEHRGFCAYHKLTLVDNKGCVDGYVCRQSDFSSRSKCFCLEKSTGNVPPNLAEFVELYQNNIYYNLSTGDTCNMGLRRYSNGSFMWTTTKQTIDYTYWSPETDFDVDLVYGASTQSGWILTDELGPCFLTERNNPIPNPKIELSFDPNANIFILRVTNFKSLQTFGYDSDIDVFCFTDAYPLEFLYRLDTSHDYIATDGNITFSPIEFYPGNYWCEAFNYSNLAIIETETIFRPVQYLEFVGVFIVKVPPAQFSTLNSDDIRCLLKSLLEKFDGGDNEENHLTTINPSGFAEPQYIARIMKIVAIDEEDSLVLLNIHFSSEIEIVSSEEETYFDSLQITIYHFLSNQNDIKMISFSSSNYCHVITIYTLESATPLNVPTTPVDEEATPQEFCFRNDGTLVKLKCIGNFMAGAAWRLPHDCQILEPSLVTSSLVELYKNPPSDNGKSVAQIFQHHSLEEFVALDVFLIEEIYREYLEKGESLDMEAFRQVVDNVLKIDKSSLTESQIVARATDKFLSIIDQLVRYPSFQIHGSNFDFISSSIADITGVYVQTLNGEHVVKTFKDEWTTGIENWEFAVWLSPDLKKGIGEVQVAFTVFFNNVFFSDFSYDMSNISIVFGVSLNVSQQEPLPGAIKVLRRVKSGEQMDNYCVRWYYEIDNVQGFWMQDGDTENADSYQVCNFFHVAHYGLAEDFIGNDDNVTADLEGLLVGEGALASDKIVSLESISEKYRKFQAMDVFLVGKVLEQSYYAGANDLTALAKTVDNIHKIDREILTKSQSESKATDLILYNIDKIVRNGLKQESDVLITTDSFVLLISSLNTSDFNGLVVFEKNHTLQAEVLGGGIDPGVLGSYDNLVSSIFLSDDLKNQMNVNDKIIITIFFSDVLFNENQNVRKPVGKIFGVILPEVGNYSGPISILHNISAGNYQTECAHWNYDINQTESFWKKDSSGKNSSHLVSCDYWHTTHFALLIFQEDVYAYVDYKILDWITTINSAISLAGLLFIFLTAALFQKWRKNIGNQILLNMSAAITLQIIVMYIADAITNWSSISHWYCTFIGVLLHYSVVAQFCWMFIIAILQFKRFVKVFAPSPQYLLLKACLLGWVAPIVPVVFSLAWNKGDYAQNDVMKLCYPSGIGLVVGVWIPISVLAAFNFSIFIYIVYNVIRSNLEHTVVRGGRGEGKYQWRLFILLFFMLGITWTFGFLSGLDLVFAYIFCFTATLQGFVLFLYFIVFNSNTRYMYVRCFKSICPHKEF